MRDKETGGYRGPTQVEGLEQDIRHAYDTPGAIFEYDGWDIKWCGWRRPPAMFIEFGVWVATRPHYRMIHYATTLGVTGTLDHELQSVDMTVKHEGVRFSDLTTEMKIKLMRWAAADLLKLVSNWGRSGS